MALVSPPLDGNAAVFLLALAAACGAIFAFLRGSWLNFTIPASHSHRERDPGLTLPRLLDRSLKKSAACAPAFGQLPQPGRVPPLAAQSELVRTAARPTITGNVQRQFAVSPLFPKNSTLKNWHLPSNQ